MPRQIERTGLNANSKLKSLGEIRNVMSFDKRTLFRGTMQLGEGNNFFKEKKNKVVLDFSGIPISKDTFRTLP